MNRDIVVAWLGLAFALSLVMMLVNASLAFSGGVSLILTLTLLFGAMKGEDVGPFVPWVVASGAVWVVSFTGMHLLSHSAENLVLGLPPATAMMVYVLWLAPLVTATMPYALHFDRFTLTEETIREIERRGEEE